MNLMRSMRHAGAFAACLLVLCGCGNKVIGIPPEPEPEQAPAPASPQAAVQRLAWSWGHRDPEPCVDLLTSDFVFASTRSDTAGPLNYEWHRELELDILRALFVDGTPARPAAQFITFLPGEPLTHEPDPRPGHDPRWHRVIDTQLSVAIRTAPGDYVSSDRARFFLVRGDKAKIPQQLQDQGYRPDSTRWWLERWEEEPIGALLSPQLGRLWLLGDVKALYRP